MPHISGARKRRQAAGLSREKLARLADVSSSTVQKLEAGYRPGADVSQRIADVLRCTVAELHEPMERNTNAAVCPPPCTRMCGADDCSCAPCECPRHRAKGND